MKTKLIVIALAAVVLSMGILAIAPAAKAADADNSASAQFIGFHGFHRGFIGRSSFGAFGLPFYGRGCGCGVGSYYGGSPYYGYGGCGGGCGSSVTCINGVCNGF